jgi:ABC-type Fe3+ transport system substrate-binding protein
MLAACGRAEQVVVYTPLDTDALAWVESSFETANPHTDLRLIPVAPGDLIPRLESHRDAPEADAVWGAPSWVLARAAGRGLLAETAPLWATAVPGAWKDPGGRWVGVSVDPVVFAVNHDSVSLGRAPRDWIDLFHPRWTDRVLVPEPGASETGSAILGTRAAESMEAYGDVLDAVDWFRRLDGVRSAYGDDDVELVRTLARGRAAVALVPLSVAQAAVEDSLPVAWVVPESGGPVVVRGVARVAGAPDPEAAGRFLAWLGSPDVAVGMEAKLRRKPAWVAPEDALPEWLDRAWTGFTPRDVSADTLAAHLDGWVSTWRSEARGRGMRVLIP